MSDMLVRHTVAVKPAGNSRRFVTIQLTYRGLGEFSRRLRGLRRWGIKRFLKPHLRNPRNLRLNSPAEQLRRFNRGDGQGRSRAVVAGPLPRKYLIEDSYRESPDGSYSRLGFGRRLLVECSAYET